MAKDPAFLFYPNDWLGGTSHMTRLERGAYIDLLVTEFNQGPLSLSIVKRVLASDFEKVWAMVEPKFERNGKGYFYNERLEEEKARRAKFTESRRANAKHNKSTSKALAKHKLKHMETEDETEDITKTETKKKSTAVDKGTENFEHVERLAPSELIPEGTFEEPPELERFLYGKFGVKPERPADYSKCVRISNFSKVAELDRVRAYFEYKDSSGQIRHGLNNFLGDPPDFENGGWNNEDWPALLEAHQKQNGEAEPVDWEKI